MARKKVVLSAFAKADFRQTLDFYNERNQNNSYSRTLAKKIRALTKLIAVREMLGTATEFEDVRVIGANPFRIYYKIEQRRIVVLLIWDARRNPEELKELLSKT